MLNKRLRADWVVPCSIDFSQFSSHAKLATPHHAPNWSSGMTFHSHRSLACLGVQAECGLKRSTVRTRHLEAFCAPSTRALSFWRKKSPAIKKRDVSQDSTKSRQSWLCGSTECSIVSQRGAWLISAHFSWKLTYRRRIFESIFFRGIGFGLLAQSL